MPQTLLQFLRGFLMGSADIVPGVSGGTIALVVGIYERLIANVRGGASALASGAKGRASETIRKLSHVEWGWLVPLGVGVLTALLVLAHTIEHLLEEQPVRMSGLFFGLVAGSVVLAWRMVGSPDAARLAVTLATAVVAFFVLGLKSGPVDDPSVALYFVAGAIAICAMILPGISGSFLLLMLGMYDNVLGLVTDRDVLPLAVFAVGCVLGLALFSTGLHWALGHHHDTVMAAMVGLLLGSLRVLWPWPDGTESTTMTGPQGEVLAVVGLMALGAAVVVGLSIIAGRRDALDDVEEAHSPT
ncbi:DUF368 domain-containing protein [Actinomarinicola tropica]|uniref:DUF368 domain-containing protein n=1 Tax=Actinomarinicola tropica TaxID=2789776 RepID=A0A5Q2RHX3_9ACTN|nr:DUF368 domain-containing protein [Actinomarinicola tropica]QGG93946.1 DUF368 domain-containing protein [Actinomarinicola tropica]